MKSMKAMKGNGSGMVLQVSLAAEARTVRGMEGA